MKALVLSVVSGAPLLLAASFGDVKGYGFGDFRTAYYSRGQIVNKEPFLPLYGQMTCAFDPVGYVGGSVWAVNAVSNGGQTADRRNAFHEVDLRPFYGYAWDFGCGWTLDSCVALQWVLLPGYRTHPPAIHEWHVGQELRNPYVTPYYLTRNAYDNDDWKYWCVGLKRTFALGYGLSLRPGVWCDFGDDRHFELQYGQSCSDGLMAVNGELRLEWTIAEHLSTYVSVQQYGVASRSGRDALQASTKAQSVTDLTIFTIGVATWF